MSVDDILAALVGVHGVLARMGRRHALVGGLAVSARAEPRATRDVDIAVAVADDEDAETLIYDLRALGYEVIATLDHDGVGRLATVRLSSPEQVVVDLLLASSGLEHETTSRATAIDLDDGLVLPVARAEELLAMKVLSMRPRREQDAKDARLLLELVPGLDLPAVRANLALIRARGYDRGEPLEDKLEQLLEIAQRDEGPAAE